MKPDAFFTKDAFDTKKYSEYPHRFVGTVACLAGAFMTSLVTVMIRKLGGKCNTLTISQYNGMYGLLLSPAFMIFQDVKNLRSHEFVTLFMMGMFGWLGQICNTRACLFEKAGKVSIVSYSQIVITMLIDFFLFGFVPDGYSVLGSLLVSSSVLSLIHANFRKTN